jgi:hypothetical protein
MAEPMSEERLAAIMARLEAVPNPPASEPGEMAVPLVCFHCRQWAEEDEMRQCRRCERLVCSNCMEAPNA